MKYSNNHGFTLVSMVVTATIIVILAAAVYAWVDPVARIGTAKDQKRRNDVLILASSLSDYVQDNNGALPVLGSVVTSTKKVLCSSYSSLTCDGDTTGCLQINDSDFTNKYLAELPVDPDKTADTDTGYYLQKSSTTDFLMVGACSTYGSDTITHTTRSNISCAAFAGGACWYYANALNKDCDTVCSDNGLICKKGVTYGLDADCALNLSFFDDCSTGCFETHILPPVNVEASAICVYTGDIVICDATGASYHSICPCE